MTALSIALLALWLAASVLAQFPLKPMRLLLRHDVFSLLPVWTFFAPRPSSFDYHLFYRVRLAGGAAAAWQEVEPCRDRTLREALWNPERRCKKVLDAAIRTLLQRLAGNRDGPPPATSKAYQTLLAHVAALPSGQGAEAIEFKILRSEGYLAPGAPRLVFRSECHPLEA